MSDEHTLKEILSQPDTWKSVLDGLADPKFALKPAAVLCSKKEIVFIGCGTSYYASLSAASMFTRVTGAKSRAVPASDILFYPDHVFQNPAAAYLGIVISRSGTTTEAVLAARKMKNELGMPTCAVSCRPESELVGICDRALLAEAADERSVVMTRSFTSMLLAIQRLAAEHSQNGDFLKELESLPRQGIDIVERARTLAREIVRDNKWTSFVYLGQGPYYGLSCEAMLKMKEMSLSVSEAYHTLEYRHGPMSMVNDRMLITFFISDKGAKEEAALLKEMKKLGAKILTVCENGGGGIRESSDYCLELNSGLSDSARLILCIPIVQLLAYHWARVKGIDPDHPKNLTQVVRLT
jgi:glucosamine--fructose-6-phosphate aminotransferase (isomerizing)